MSRFKGDEIVISGIAGIFPNAGNVQQLEENLYNKVDMVTRISSSSTQYSYVKNPDVPQYLGTAKGMEKFDAHFFRVTARQATCLDPTIGKLMEQTYCALFDAGINPETLKGSKMGVYMATKQTDSVVFFYSNANKGNPLRLTGTSSAMLSNRISYWIDAKGPSITFESGFTGSMAALEKACEALKNGEIDCAIVGGTNFCILPELAFNMKRIGLLCLDGKTKCFDKTGDGFVRADAVNVYLLQRAKDAKRIYSEVYHVKSKYFASSDGLFSPNRNPTDIEKFLDEFYSEVDVSPEDVEYVEANSFGIAEADGNELEAIGNFFAKNKTIQIGSVKSNMGHTEAASGACAVTKMCLAYQKGQIAPNLHYKEPQNHIKAVKEQKLKVVTDILPFSRNFTAINNFCFTGSNYHALLKGHYKPKDTERYKSSLPRLVLLSGRKEENCNTMMNILETIPVDPELLALLNNFYKHYVPGHTGRGYTILDTNENNETVCLSKSFEFYSGKTRPIWFLFSGMGSQWAGMGEGLLRIPVFASAIEKCREVLLPKGLDITKIITNKDSESFDILNSMVAITAMQIGITDVLTSLGIVPDNIIGHSVGEIACAYADGSLTAEETILASYYRGLAAFKTEFIKGKMAAIGLGHKEVTKLSPPEIEIACHNSSESTTISGPADAVTEFVKSLTNQGIFAKEVNSYNIAFHSRYIAKAGPMMLALLKKLITDPKPRSKKWISTCYLPEYWHKPDNKYVTAEYMVHNLLSSVYFEEAANSIPNDALIIEIAPHGLLQAIMKRSHSQCLNMSLTRRGESDGAMFLLKTIGNLYQIGLNPDLEALYPKVEFPVSTETSVLSHLVGWDYNIDWENPFIHDEHKTSSTKKIIISMYDDDYAYLKDYIKNGVHILPEAALLVYVWETLADIKNMNYNDMSVRFENIKIHEQIYIQPEEDLHLEIAIQRGSNKFEVTYKGNIVVDGIINNLNKTNNQFFKSSTENRRIKFKENEKLLSQNDIYTIMRTRGYSYEGDFQSIMSSNIERNKASIKWNEQWITFLDSIIQLKTLSNDHDGVSYLKLINKLTINTNEHKYSLETTKLNGVQYYEAIILEDIGVNKCGGVISQDLVFDEVPKIEIISDFQNLKINVLDYSKSKLYAHGIPANSTKNVQRVELIAKEPNNVESLIWTEAPVITNKANIQVCYSGLSMKDYKKLYGSDNECFGMDFSGFDRNGQRVMGILPRGALANTVEADYELLWPVPQHWSMAEAATVPLPFVHAFYCLSIRSFVSKNSNIFVIGAAGALGQAVICIALSLGCTIFGTVANADKKKFILKLFPELDENNIGYTYDDTFKAMVVKRTNNKKCKIVISSGSGKTRETAMGCVGFLGHFLDVNDHDQKENENLTMYFLDPDTSYKSVNMAMIFIKEYIKYKKILHGMLVEGIVKGFVRPLTSVIFSPLDVTRAFKLLSTRSNRGRVLINMQESVTLKRNISQIPRVTLYSNKSYIVLWDGSEIGVELIDLFIKRGIKHLMIHCDPKLMKGYFHVKYASWIKLGVIIKFNSDDLQTDDKCQNLIIATETKLGLLDGIFITRNDYAKTISTQKQENVAMIVSHLDVASRKCTKLRYFGFITTATLDNVFDEYALKQIKECCLQRNDLGFPSLFLRHTLENKVLHQMSMTAMFNALELSLSQKYVNVCTSYTMEYGVGKKEGNITKTKLRTSFGAGLKAFYRHISEDEVHASEPIVQMNTKLGSKFESELSIDPEDTYFIMIAGLEGNSEYFTSLSERLKKRAIVLQLDPGYTGSIPEIAKMLLKHVKANIHVKSPFHVMGYSFGVNVALEMAALLEKEGLLGVVYCLDSSPDALRVHLDAYLGVLTDEQLQNCLIEHIYTLLTGDKSDELNVNKITEWSEKIEMLINKAKYNVHHSHEYIRSLIQAVYNKINMAKEYKPNFKLDSELVLLKGVPHPNARKLSNDYNLAMYTNKSVTVFDIESDHAMAPFDCRVPNYINRFFVL